MTTIQTSAPLTEVQTFLKELEQESQLTRKMLALIPDDKYDWQPHPKSMTLKALANHLAELPTWIPLALKTSGIDFENNPYQAEENRTTKDVLAYLEKSLQDANQHLLKASDEDLFPEWTMRSGEHIITVMTKGEVIRVTINQTIHHRAQLGVFLRLLNIPIPGTYGPSFDELNGLI